MNYFEFNGHQIRIIDARPNSYSVQINVFNPADLGASLSRRVALVDGNNQSIQEIYQQLVDDLTIQALVNRAIQVFAG